MNEHEAKPRDTMNPTELRVDDLRNTHGYVFGDATPADLRRYIMKVEATHLRVCDERDDWRGECDGRDTEIASLKSDIERLGAVAVVTQTTEVADD